MAGSRLLSKLPGARLMEPMMARWLFREDEFRVKLKMLQSVYFDANIIQRPQTSYCLDKLGLWSL
jgi:hypothetical protein